MWEVDARGQRLEVSLRVWLILGFLGMFVFSVAARGQSVKASSEVVRADELKTQEQILDELKLTLLSQFRGF